MNSKPLQFAKGEFLSLKIIYFSPTGTTQKALGSIARVQKAMDFGAKIRDKLTALQAPDAQIDLEIPGRFPYKGRARSMGVSPVTKEDTCTFCSTYASVCPTAAISINGSVTTKIELCIRCCACIKNCPTGATVWKDTR